jgi:hypothetical protein
MSIPVLSPRPRRPRNRRQPPALVIGITILALTGCSHRSTPPTGSATRATPTTPTTPTRTSLGYTPEDPNKIGSWAEFTSSVTGTPEQQAALQTWRTYLQVSAEAFNTQGLSISTPESVKALDAVATGNGKTNIFAVVAARRKAGTFSVGRMIVTSASVQVHGNTAVISACADDQSYEVDQTGKTVTPAPGAQAFTSTLVRTARAWKVTDSKLGGLTCPAAS